MSKLVFFKGMSLAPDGHNFSINVFHKPNKSPMYWSSQTPRRYKRLGRNMPRLVSPSNAGFPKTYLMSQINPNHYTGQTTFLP